MSLVFGRSKLTCLTVAHQSQSVNSPAFAPRLPRIANPRIASRPIRRIATKTASKSSPTRARPSTWKNPSKSPSRTIVTRENLPEKYDDGKTIRVEREVAHYSDNNFAADGKYREYYPTGKPFIEGQFKAGRQTGDWTYYFENGQVNRKATYVDGKPNGSWEVHRDDGTLAAKRGFKDGVRDGEWITYDSTGKQPLAEEHYASGEQDGVWKVWFPNGKLKTASHVQKRQTQTAQAPNGTTKAKNSIEADYADGKLNGTAIRYLPDGKKITQTYKDGRFVSETK